MRFCTRCGSVLGEEHRFCGRCGAAAEQQPAQPPAVYREEDLIPPQYEGHAVPGVKRPGAE